MGETNFSNARVASDSLDRMFVERWSSKAFTDDRLPEQQIAVLFEAATGHPHRVIGSHGYSFTLQRDRIEFVLTLF